MLSYQRQACIYEKCICIFEEWSIISTNIHSYCSNIDFSSCCWYICLWDKAYIFREECICLSTLLLSTLQLSLLSLLWVFSKTFFLSAFPALVLLLPIFNFTLYPSSLAVLPSFPCPLLHPPAPPANEYLFSVARLQPAADRQRRRAALGSAPATPAALRSWLEEMAELQLSCYHREKCSQQRVTGSSQAVKSKFLF